MLPWAELGPHCHAHVAPRTHVLTPLPVLPGVLLQAPGTPTASVTPSAGDDTPFGFGPAPSLTGSVAAFKRRCEWFYVDPNGEEHGPVPYTKLSSWYKKGHFPDEVKVRAAGGLCGARCTQHCRGPDLC